MPMCRTMTGREGVPGLADADDPLSAMVPVTIMNV
jgi:hypothetical protein